MRGFFYGKRVKKKKMKNRLVLGIIILACLFALSGCSQTYPPGRIKESIAEICRREYGIENIRVEIAGTTAGVFLPVKKLFVSDIKEIFSSGKAQLADMENLFQPSPEAMDQVEDVLFSISRVLLSTNLKLDFYVLQATDVEKTGLQLILTGYVNDIKRVRLWDISRDEYRKRIIHELGLNKAVVWHQPVREFFAQLEKGTSSAGLEQHFERPLPPDFFEALFWASPEVLRQNNVLWRLGELRSTLLETTKALVYVPVQVEYDSKGISSGNIQVPSGSSLEYFFIVSFASPQPKISRILPLTYLDENGKVQKIPISEEFDFQQDIQFWEREFHLTEIHLGDFLAEQLNRRSQAILSMDERIQNTFQALRLNFRYHRDEPKNYFSLDMDVKLKSAAPLASPPSVLDEDILYLLNRVSREFVLVLRSYGFLDYKYLQLNLASDPISRILAQEDLELFRQNKMDLQGLLGRVTPL